MITGEMSMSWVTLTFLVVFGSCSWTPAGGQTPCSLSAVQFGLSTVTVGAESVDSSTPAARVTWSTTIPPECVTSVTVEFRTDRLGEVVANYTTTNTSQTEVHQTGLQCATYYYIRVVVTGETSGGEHVTQSSNQVQVLVGDIPAPVGVRAEVTADNTSIRVSWQWSRQGLLMCVDLVRVHYQPEGGSVMSYTVSNTTATSATLPNLQCNAKATTYTITLYASGLQINRTSATRMVSLPARGTPRLKMVTALNSTSVVLSWSEVQCFSGSGTVTHYLVQYHSSCCGGGTVQNVTTDGLVQVISGLAPNTVYTFRVAAVGASQTIGPFSNPANTSLPETPSEVPAKYLSIWAVAGIVLAALFVLLVMALIQTAANVYLHRFITRMKNQARRAKTAEISLKQCSAYGQIDREGADREETPIYEFPQ